MQMETVGKAPQPKPLWTFFLPKTKSLMVMHRSIPFNFISGDRLQIPDHVWSLELPPGLRGAASPRSRAMVIAEHAALLPSLPVPMCCPQLPRVLPQKRLTRILTLTSTVSSVLLGANSECDFSVGFPLPGDCSDIQLCNPVVPELLPSILSRESPFQPIFLSSCLCCLLLRHLFPLCDFLSGLLLLVATSKPCPGFSSHPAASALRPSSSELPAFLHSPSH